MLSDSQEIPSSFPHSPASLIHSTQFLLGMIATSEYSCSLAVDVFKDVVPQPTVDMWIAEPSSSIYLAHSTDLMMNAFGKQVASVSSR